MNISNRAFLIVRYFSFLLIGLTCISNAVASGNDEDSFVFVGQCLDGSPYRLFSYQRSVDGLTESFYDYAGPAGTGTVLTSASARTMSARVCRAMAEIADASKFK